MRNVIQLLPDAIANQIAAGEVVQRPASVVKELLENAVDAGASRIDLLIKNAGKSLIQVSDNGAGMSAQDARMAFERHATSKIREQDDLFRIQTLGFRGEALASIAAVAQVRLRTRLQEAELGVELDVEASKVTRQEAWAGLGGSTFMVRNLFFNVPARRNFLKSNPVETRHVINELIRVALPNPDIHFTFTHGDTQVYDLPPGSVEERLIALFGKELRGELIRVDEAAGYATFEGFIGSPAINRKSRGDQYFFVNGRFIRSNYLHHAIAKAFEDYLPEDTHPFYCIFLGIDPVHVDINIHPTKTEVKFDDERTLYILLQGLIKQGLGEHHQVPNFNFGDTPIKQAIYQSGATIEQAKDATIGSTSSASRSSAQPWAPREQVKPDHWDQLYRPGGKETPQESFAQPEQKSGEQVPLLPTNRRPEFSEASFVVQFQQRYILTQLGEELLIVDQHQAHYRVLFERFMNAQKGQAMASQQLLFPQTLEFQAQDYLLLLEVDATLQQMGFEVKEFGRNSLVVYGTPTGVATHKIRDIFEQILSDVKITGGNEVPEARLEAIARVVAQRSAIASQASLTVVEMRRLLSDLFRCESPTLAPGGRPILKKISEVELEEYFK